MAPRDWADMPDRDDYMVRGVVSDPNRRAVSLCKNPLGPVPKLGSCSEVHVGVTLPSSIDRHLAQDTIEVQDLMCSCIHT